MTTRAATENTSPEATSNLQELLNEGITLNRELAEKSTRLTEIKDALRHHAEALKGEEKTVELKTSDGTQTVSVTFPDPSLSLKSKVKVDGLKANLGDLIFSLFFSEKVSYSIQKDFEDNISKVSDPLQRQALEGAVEKKEATPRVSFPK